MGNILSEDKLNKLLPALSLLAEDVGEKTSLNSNSLEEILLSVNAAYETWAEEELKLWLMSLEKVKKDPNKAQKDSVITELKNRGIPEFPAMLAVYVVTNQQNTAQIPASIKPSPVPSKAEPFNRPAEPFHPLLPDHGWHNDLTWEQLPDWIKTNRKLIAALKRGEQVIGKNVRYRYVGNKLIRRLRDRIPVAMSPSNKKPIINAPKDIPVAKTGASFSFIDNTQLLRNLMDKKLIRLNNSPVLSHMPGPLPVSFSYEKIEGMLLGIAIGDALGATNEGLKPSARRKLYGEIRDYQSDRRPHHHRQAGQVTDDTQLSFWTVEQLIDDRGLRPDSLARKFCKYRIWGIGGTVKNFIGNYKDRHMPWYQAGTESLGNGALMRITPIVLPYLRNPHPSMYADAAIDTMITHNDFANNASNVAFVYILWELLKMNTPPEPSWWIDTYCSIAKELEGNTRYQRASKAFGKYSGSLWNFTSNVCKDAMKKGLTVEEACNNWGSGANIFETVPSVLYILATHAHDPEEAIVRAVNDTKDNDTVASIVGAAVGALHGIGGIPGKWIKNLNGKIRDEGGNQVLKLILYSKQAFWL